MAIFLKGSDGTSQVVLRYSQEMALAVGVLPLVNRMSRR
jgi:hypothetical protein